MLANKTVVADTAIHHARPTTHHTRPGTVMHPGPAPIVANLDFGHTDPQWVLPLGIRAELDIDARALRLIEPWLS
jgi:muramoyltetrapeptide carboxypeptidase LdcA involved in peptidoglycan recycling